MEPGDKIGRYLLEQRLGEGAMSEVFVARHPQLEPRVAVKIIRREVSADQQYAARFLEDARLAASLNHPNIVRVTDFDTADGLPFIVMDLVDGGSLEQLLKSKGRLEICDAARIARDIALGLGAAHSSKIVHRDVKPSNVLIENRSGVTKLTDFGAAKRDRPEDQALTAHGQTIGTPRYMAPEQVHGDPVDPRTDLWALGATLFEMLAGQPAFSANSLPRLYQAIIADDPPRLVSLRPDTPPELAALVGRLLSKARVARPNSADEVAEALLPFTRANPAATAQQPTPAIRTVQGEATIPPRSNPARAVLIGGGVAAAVVAAGLVYWLLPAQEPPPPDTVAVTSSPVTTPEPPSAVPQAPQGETAAAPAAAPAGDEPPPPPVVAAAPAVEPPAAPSEPTTTVVPTAPAEPEPAPRQEQAALPPKPVPSAIDETALKTALLDLPCTAVIPTVADGDVVSLAGTVPDAELAAQVRRAIEAVPGVTSVTDALRMVPAPACLAAAGLRRSVSAQAESAPTFTVNRPDGVYREGDFLVVTATMPTGPAEYLYVDLLTDAGSAIHMLPEPMTPGNRLSPGQAVRLGVEEAEQAEGVRYWRVAPPLGTGYLVLTASQKPLYAGMREIEEPLQGYVDVLLTALKDPANGASAVAVERLEFRERGL